MDNFTVSAPPIDIVASRLLRRTYSSYEREGITIRDIVFGVFCFCILLMCRLILCEERDDDPHASSSSSSRHHRRRRRDEERRSSQAYVTQRTKYLLEHNVLVPSALNHLDVTTVSDEERTCAICLDPLLGDNDSAQRRVVGSTNASCTHLFHQECIVEWLLQHDDCPVCRGQFAGTGAASGGTAVGDTTCLPGEEVMETEVAV